MNLNRQQRRIAERKSAKAGTTSNELLHSLANLDGVANLSAQITEFLQASQRMEAIAGKLDQAETFEALGNAKELITTIREQFQAILETQERHDKVLYGILFFLSTCYPEVAAQEDLSLLKSELRGT